MIVGTHRCFVGTHRFFWELAGGRWGWRTQSPFSLGEKFGGGGGIVGVFCFFVPLLGEGADELGGAFFAKEFDVAVAIVPVVDLAFLNGSADLLNAFLEGPLGLKSEDVVNFVEIDAIIALVGIAFGADDFGAFNGFVDEFTDLLDGVVLLVGTHVKDLVVDSVDGSF